MKNGEKIEIVKLKIVKNRTEHYQSLVLKSALIELSKKLLENNAVEAIIVIGVDTNLKPTVIYFIDGDVNQCTVYIKTIFKILLLSNSASFFIAHNHPANSLTASEMDWVITNKLYKAGKLMDLELIDHLIFNSSCDESNSLRLSPRWGMDI